MPTASWSTDTIIVNGVRYRAQGLTWEIAEREEERCSLYVEPPRS